MPMYDSLADQIKYFLLNGGDYHVAPDLGADVLDAVDAFGARFLDYREHERHAHVLWDAHCWLMDCWSHTPRLLFISPEANCGKSTAMKVTKAFVPRASHLAVLTPAALYKAIYEALERKGGRPTILYDELDAVFGSEGRRRLNERMRSEINAGHGRGENIALQVGGKVKEFELYAPMALAGKMGIYDVPDTIRTRSIIIPMQRRLEDGKGERWDDRIHPVEAEPIRWMLRCWVELVHSYALDYVKPGRPVLPKGVWNRDADVWEPLLAVAELAGGHWPERARVAAVAGVAAAGARAVPSSGIDLLADIKTVFDRRHVEKIFTTDLLADLTTLDQRWRRLDGKRLARMLHSYGMTQTNQDQRIGTRVTKGYRREYFEDAWSRYLPAAATSATPATDEGDDDE